MGGVVTERLRPLAGELLLAAWENGARCHELYRPLALLAAALRGSNSGPTPAGLAALPVAERDLLLVRLREVTFGAELGMFGHCEACGEPLELTLRADEVAAGLEAAATAIAAALVEWIEAGRRYRLRSVTTEDLAATLAIPDPDAAGELLLARCVEVDGSEGDPGPPHPGHSPSPHGMSAPSASVPSSAVSRFEQLHADAEIRCAIDCPACRAQQVLDLDIGRFLWREVSAAARRLIAEVHLLASAYGWTEQDILALSPARRAAYLELTAGDTA
jgi:hypothetical protein